MPLRLVTFVQLFCSFTTAFVVVRFGWYWLIWVSSGGLSLGRAGSFPGSGWSKFSIHAYVCNRVAAEEECTIIRTNGDSPSIRVESWLCIGQCLVLE